MIKALSRLKQQWTGPILPPPNDTAAAEAAARLSLGRQSGYVAGVSSRQGAKAEAESEAENRAGMDMRMSCRI